MERSGVKKTANLFFTFKGKRSRSLPLLRKLFQRLMGFSNQFHEKASHLLKKLYQGHG